MISARAIGRMATLPLGPRQGDLAVAGSLRHRAEESAAPLPPLLVAAERIAATVAQGVHGRRRVGQGETFWQFRQYEPGDAASRIDWRESGKSQRLYVRETEWEAAQSVWLWRDASASMDYSSAAYIPGGDWPTKRERAELILVALASLLVRAGERLCLLGSSMTPMSGRIALTRVVDLVERGEVGADGLPRIENLPRHAQLVLIGDFLGSLEATNRIVAGFAAAGLAGHLLQIVDPAEEDLPFDGRVRFEGVEERGELLVGRVETIRDAYAGRFREHRAALQAMTQAAGWSFGTHRTDRPPYLALLALHATLAPDRRK
jgi:uncharacterized protein (DUF58 family)